MSWELALAGGLESGDAAERLREAVVAAASGDRRRFDEVMMAAELEVAGSLLAEDVSTLRVLLDPEAAQPASYRKWISGAEDAPPPRGVCGVVAAHPSREMTEDPAWVIVGPEGPGRRVLSPGIGLRPGVRTMPPGKRRRGRTDAAASALALRSEAIDEVSLFERLYGFRYQPSLHQGARDTLYYRVRERLGESATLVREGGTIRLERSVALAVPDPRCSPPPEHALLAVLARKGEMSVREAAAALQIPLRTAQHALRALAEDGALQADKKGRELRYVLEDTTFCEPTRSTQVE